MRPIVRSPTHKRAGNILTIDIPATLIANTGSARRERRVPNPIPNNKKHDRHAEQLQSKHSRKPNLDHHTHPQPQKRQPNADHPQTTAVRHTIAVHAKQLNATDQLQPNNNIQNKQPTININQPKQTSPPYPTPTNYYSHKYPTTT